MTGPARGGVIESEAPGENRAARPSVPPHPMRRSTRVSWRVRVRLNGLDRNKPFTADGETLVVNLQGCALQCPCALRSGSPVQLEVGPNLLRGRVMDTVAMGEDHGRWLVGIALEQSGNHWGIQFPPEDWGTPPASLRAAASAHAPPQIQPAPAPVLGGATATDLDVKTVAIAPAVPEREPTAAISSPECEPPVAARPPVPSATSAALPTPNGALQELRAQLVQLQQAQARLEAMLFQERDARQAARADGQHSVADHLERVRQAREYVESLVCSFPAMVETHAQEVLRRFQPQALRSDFEKLARDSQQAAEAALQQRAAQLLHDLQRQVEQTFAERRQAFDSACAAAADQLHQSELTQRQAEIDYELGALLRHAGDAASELRLTLKSVQQEHRMNEAATARLRHQAEEVQAWLDKETEKFQRGLREAFIEAGGEIRGRIAQAVETAAEPIEVCSREIQAQLASLAERHVKELHHHADVACERMECSSEESQAAVANALQARLAQALEGFTHDAQRLTEESMERWQAAVSQTLSAIPKLLADHFAGQR